MSYLFGGTSFDGYSRDGRRSLNFGGGGGSQSTGTTYQTNIPEWLRAPTERMVARGETLSEQPYQPYTGTRIADFNPAQQAAFQQVYGLQTPGEFGAAAQGISTGYGAAAGAAGLGNQYAGYAADRANAFNVGDFNAANFGVGLGTAAAASAADRANAYNAGQFDTAAAQQYMSPYQQAVTDITKREAAMEAQQANRMLASNAAKAGAFGGSRFGLEQAQVYRSGLQNLSDIQAKGSQAAFENAQQQFERDRQARQFGANLGLQGSQLLAQTGLQGAQTLAQQQQAREAQRMQAENLALQGSQLGAQTALQGGQLESNAALQGAQQLASLGQARQAADLQRIQALSSVGAQQQALAQQKLDTEYQQAMEQRDWEKNQLGFLAGLVRGSPFSTTQLQTAPSASTASQIASLGLGAYGLANLFGGGGGKKNGGVIKMAKGGSVSGYAQGGSVDMYPDEVLEAVVAGKSDAVLPMEAERELRRRRMLRTAVEGTEADKTLMDGKSLADKAEESGIANLPADNMEFADGGIIGYAEGGSIPRYNGNKEYGSVVYGGIEYPIDPTTGKVLYKGAWTSPSLLKGSAASPWNTVGVKPEQTVQQKADAIAANEQMIADVQAGKGVMKNGSYYPIITEGKNAGKVDYKGIPTMLDKRMFDSTPPERLVKPSADNTLQAEHLAAAVPPTAPAATPAAAPAAPAGRPGVAPGSSAAGNVVQKLAAQDEDPYARMLAGAKRVREEMAAGETDPFKDLRASMAEQKAAYADMRNEGRGLAALQAAAAIAQGGPGGTWGQIGRGMGALGEAGFKLQNQLQAARQADISSRVMMAQAEEARNRGLRGEAIQLATSAEQAGLQAAKLKQDYNLGMAQINATRANAGRNTQLELIQALQKNPDLLKTYQGMHGPQEKPLSDADILKSWDPLKYPGMTYSQYYASMKNAGSMAPTSSLSAADQALVNKYAK